MEKINLKEIWKPIVNYEGYYEVSNLGNVRSIDRIVKTKKDTVKIIKGKQHKLTLTKSGYISVTLYKDSKQKSFRVHRLVAEAFIPNPNNFSQVNHIDENKSNNCVTNLEWCSASYNIKIRSKKNERKILQYDKNGNFIKIWNSIKQVSEELNIKYTTIQAAVSDNHFSSGCFWKYYFDEFPLKIDVNISKFTIGHSIYQYDLEGNFIREWNKISEAEHFFNCERSGINKVCKLKNGYTYKKYQWRYKEDIEDINLNIGKARIREGVYKIDQYALNGEFIKTWDNASQAGKSLGNRDRKSVV